MSDDTRKEQKPIEDEKLDQVSGGYVIEHNPTKRPTPPGEGVPPKSPVERIKPM